MKRITLGFAIGLMLAIGGIAEGSAKEPNLPQIREIFEKLVNEKFAGAILMTNKECKGFGTEWRRYEPISGRFALAAGPKVGDNREKEEFEVGNRGGEYDHILTVPEMPSHQHEYQKASKHHQGRDVLDYGDDQKNSHDRDESPMTKPAGGGEPHNNMPPYLALNFCHFSP